MANAFPDHPFWNYSLRLYAQPGVQEASLTLQDEHGLDVNLVLFCIWCGMEGPGELTADELNQAMAVTGPWQADVVEPVRTIRRTLKHNPRGADPELIQVFRPRVQALELDGEHVEQLMLAALVPLQRGAQSRAAAQANLLQYLDRCAICAGSVASELAMRILDTASGLTDNNQDRG